MRTYSEADAIQGKLLASNLDLSLCFDVRCLSMAMDIKASPANKEQLIKYNKNIISLFEIKKINVDCLCIFLLFDKYSTSNVKCNSNAFYFFGKKFRVVINPTSQSISVYYTRFVNNKITMKFLNLEL